MTPTLIGSSLDYSPTISQMNVLFFSSVSHPVAPSPLRWWCTEVDTKFRAVVTWKKTEALGNSCHVKAKEF